MVRWTELPGWLSLRAAMRTAQGQELRVMRSGKNGAGDPMDKAIGSATVTTVAETRMGPSVACDEW